MAPANMTLICLIVGALYEIYSGNPIEDMAIRTTTLSGRLANYHAYIDKKLAEVKHYQSAF